MNMFYWKSDAIKDWTQGYLIAIASNEEAAKEKIKSQIKEVIINHFQYIIYDGEDDYDNDDKKDLYNKLKEIDKDLSKPPFISDVLIIPGGS